MIDRKMAVLVHELLSEAVARAPAREAVVTHEPGAVRWSYGELAVAAARVTAQLIGLGVARGDRVALLAHNGAEWIAGWYGALAAGAVVVPINTAADPHSLVHYVGDAGAQVLIVGPRLERVVAQAGARLGAIAIVAPAASAAKLQEATPGATVIAAASDGHHGPAAIEPGDRAAIIYTSGSTGRPRGAVLTHANLIANTRSIVAYLSLGDDERTLAHLPFYYVYGLSVLNMTVAVAGTVVVENRFQYPQVVLDHMERERVTGLSGVPSTYAILMHRTNFGERLATGLGALRRITQAGGGMSPTLTRALLDAVGPQRQLFVMYGATEASARLSYVAPDELPAAMGSIGRAIPGVELTVRNPDGGECAVDEAGELYARGPNIMQGYWNDPDETARVLGPHGYRTGDLARRDTAGRLWLVGRARDLLKVGGHRVSAKEIEDAIVEHPGVLECAVIGVADELLGDKLRAFVVAKEPGALDANAIGGFLKDRLPAYKIPSTIELRDDLPKNPSGKIMKDALRGG